MCFDDQALCRDIDIGLQLFQIGDEQYAFQQFIDTLAGLCADFDHDRITAPFLGVQFVLSRQLRLYQLGIGGIFVNLVDSDDDLGVGFVGEADRFDGLRFDTVIRRYHDDDHVRQRCTVLTKRREGLMAWRVEQRHGATVTLHLVGADVLSNAAGFTFHNLLAEDGIQKAGLAVIDMAHHRYDRWPFDGVLGYLPDMSFGSDADLFLF